MTHITTLSFPLNIEKLFCKTISRSILQRLQRKLLFAMTLNSKRLDMIKTTCISYATSLQNIVVATWLGYLKALLHVNYLNNFLCLENNSGEESSGVMVSILPQYQSGETGNQSSDMFQTKERQYRHIINLSYSNSCLGSYPVGLPRGN